MKEIFKRSISGTFYVAILWFGTSYSYTTFVFLFAILGLLSLYEMWKLRKGRAKILAFTYILTPFLLIQLSGIMKDSNYSNICFDSNLMLFIFILTWSFDTFAYLVGVRFGNNKIRPSISPNKSWEGFTGGFIFTIIASYISLNYFELFNSIKHPLLISIFLPFTATIGDFIESYYKRKAGVKNSGNLIPGHGGILDRMDAFIITIPVMYIINLL